MMNEDAKLEFDRITAIIPSEMTKEEISFLRSRRAYLRPEQLSAFATLLKDKKSFPDMTKEQQAEHEKRTQRALIQAKKDTDALAKETKTVQESQNADNK